MVLSILSLKELLVVISLKRIPERPSRLLSRDLWLCNKRKREGKGGIVGRREGRKDREREGGREGRKDGEREGGKEGRTERGREGRKEGRRDQGREVGMKGGKVGRKKQERGRKQEV